MIHGDLYMEVGGFLSKQYNVCPDEWLCRRLMMCLFAGQYVIRRSETGKITTYVGWWLIDREVLDKIIEKVHIPDDITKGNMVWVMDAASIDKTGIREAQKHLRNIYPRTGTVKGIAWLRNEERPVKSLRQQGV